ncbi:MAG: rubrerythrin [archaeon]
MEETIKNLTKAFIGESQARNRYTIYAKVALKEGFENISEIFLKTADQEREHAKWLFRFIQELKKSDELVVEATATLVLGDTKENLKAAIAGEHYEYEEMYPEFADLAEKEGLKEISSRLRAIAKAEAHHEERYKKLLEQVENGTMFKKEESQIWACRQCGYEHEGNEPPKECPSCGHPPNYFEIKCEKY